MPKRLRPEEIVTIQVLKTKGSANREIARKLGVTEGAVRYQLRRLEEERPDRRREKPHQEARLLPLVSEWMESRVRDGRPANIRHLHEHLVERGAHAPGEAAYRRLLRLVRAHFPPPKRRTYRRIETPPGVQAQTDWGEFRRMILGGVFETLYAFVMVLSHSRMVAVIWSRRMDLLSWLHCHNEALKRLDGVPATNRIDNLKTGVISGAGSTAKIHPVFSSYSHSMRFHVDPCPPRAPEAKGKSEAKVRLCRLITESMRRGAAHLCELQELTDQRILSWSKTAICPATGKSVFESWEAEREHLQPLPDPLPEPFDVAVIRTVHKDCTVRFEGRQYTVPFHLSGKSVEVRGCAEVVQIAHEGQVIKEWPRHTDERILIDPACYEGESTDEVLPPPPLGRMGKRIQELWEMPVASRSVDHYAMLAEVAR